MKTQNTSGINTPSTVTFNDNVKENAVKDSFTAAEIQTWLVSYLAELFTIEPTAIDTKTNFDRYGLDSSAAAGMIGDLEDYLEYELDPTWIYDYPTIESLSNHLSKEIGCR